jgi:hypothetical protein
MEAAIFMSRKTTTERTYSYVNTWFSSPDTPRWEQAFSADEGKTWETNWMWTLSRVRNESDKVH